MNASLLTVASVFAWFGLLPILALGESPPDLVPHEVHLPRPLPTAEANEVRRIAIQTDGTLWAATRGGVFWRKTDAGASEPSAWQSVASPESLAPAFAVATAPHDEVWIGAWNGLYRVRDHRAVPVDGCRHPITALAFAPDGLALAGGPDGYLLVREGTVQPQAIRATRYLHRIHHAPSGDWWLATGMGTFAWNPAAEGGYLPFKFDQVSADVRDIAFTPQGAWAAALGGLQVIANGTVTRVITPTDGLPSADVRCVATTPDGNLWAGTARGVARSRESGWTVRSGRRWLLSDDVRDLVPAPDGTMWIATAAGVSGLRPSRLTLADKSRHFHAILEARHVRPPGIVEKCRFRRPGDVSTWEPEDDDNDGGYTALAMAMESYRYAVSRDPAALAAARRAWSACEFLLRITGTNGFLARTVVPADWTRMHDANESIPDPDWAARRADDPRNKRVPVRWRPSADGQWLWKGDTSSDEITAHFFGYYLFHELAADEGDRRRVRDQVARITDHLLANGLVLRDLDGRPTRWGVWAPERLNNDPDWAMERGINSVEILSFLKLAHYLTGDPRYQREYRRLIDDHHYDRNVLEAPNLNPAWRTYIDIELLAFAYPALLALESDPALRGLYLQSFERWHQAIRDDGNPFFEFLYAAYADPTRANLEGARAFLKDAPLDLIRWTVDLSEREDLHLVRYPQVERWQTDRMLPASEIGYSRTDQNPRAIHQGDGGRTESDGVFWLLPYWMGRHHGWL